MWVRYGAWCLLPDRYYSTLDLFGPTILLIIGGNPTSDLEEREGGVRKYKIEVREKGFMARRILLIMLGGDFTSELGEWG